MKRFKLTIKSGIETLSITQGRDIPSSHITVADMEKVIEVEQYLEKMFGLRFHIQEAE